MKKLLSLFFLFILISAQSFAGVSSPVSLFGNAALSTNIFDTGDGSLQDVVDSTVFDLDITQGDSYTSGQVWKNLVTSPADGSSQTDNDWNLGVDASVSSTDPTPSNAGTSSGKWDFDGTQLFTKVSGNTAFLNAIHKKGTGEIPWWFAAAFNKSDGTWNNNDYLFGTRPSNATVGPGVAVHFTSAERLSVRQGEGVGSTICNSPVYASPAGDHIIIASYDPVTSKVNFWTESLTLTQVACVFKTTSASPVGDPAILAAASDGGNNLVSEDEVYAMAMGNEFIGDTEAAAIISAWETRHSRTYIP